MKRAFFLFIVVFLFPVLTASAETQKSFSAQAPSSLSEIQLERLAERICELGYSADPIVSLRYEKILSLLSGDLYDVPVSPSSLFSYDAPYALITGKKDGYFIGSMPHETVRIDQAQAAEILTAGTTYTITDEETGVQVRMKYIGSEGTASVFSPGSKWDAATLSGTFEEFFDYRTRECSIKIGENSFLAYCQIPPSFMTDETPAGCLLYWNRPAGLSDLLSASIRD